MDESLLKILREIICKWNLLMLEAHWDRCFESAIGREMDELANWLKANDKREPKGNPMSNVDHPKHYNMGKIEVIDAIEDWQLDFHLGNAVKYIARAKHKGNELEDLEKAMWYLKRRIVQLRGIVWYGDTSVNQTDSQKLPETPEAGT